MEFAFIDRKVADLHIPLPLKAVLENRTKNLIFTITGGIIKHIIFYHKRRMKMYKNIEKQTKLELKNLVDYQPGQVVSKTLVQNDAVSMTIFSFDKGEEISTHAAGGDAMVTVLEGTGRFTVDGEVFILNAGETLIMPKDIPHAVFGEEQFKMQLVVSY